MKINLMVCCDKLGNIGKQGELPWDTHFKEDMLNFTRLTTGEGRCINGVLMGRKTWQSLPERHRPLKNRRNYILSSTLPLEQTPNWTSVYPDFDVAIVGAKLDGIKELWVIGGEQLYKEAIARSNLLSNFWVTIVNKEYDNCDRQFPLEVLNELFPGGPSITFPYMTKDRTFFSIHRFS